MLVLPGNANALRPSSSRAATRGSTPPTIFDAEPGELFIIRNVGGHVPRYAPDGGCHGTSAALEYAVKILKVRRIVVLGHEGSEGIHAMIHGPLRNARDFLTPWVDIAEPVMWPIPEPLRERVWTTPSSGRC